MASIVNDSNGRKRILFMAGDGRRKAIRLGKATMKQAEAFKVKLEGLIGQSFSEVVDDEISRWLAGLDDRTHERLATVGLVTERHSLELSAWIDKYFASRSELKPESRRKLEQTKGQLLAFFGTAKPLRAITVSDAADWRQAILAKGLSEATVKIHSGNAKTIFNEAVRRELISKSPFEYLPSGATAAKNERYVTPDEIEQVIEACPSHEWKLLFGLARLAGLRVPSETHRLTWADVDWNRARLIVHSPKTERFEGHEKRTVPITPRLMRILQDAFDAAEPGEEKLVRIRGKGAVIRRVRTIWKAAGVEEWPRLWQTLRSSCEKEWAMTFPQFAVSRWIGHSITVSGRHYANVTERLKASQRGALQNQPTNSEHVYSIRGSLCKHY